MHRHATLRLGSLVGLVLSLAGSPGCGDSGGGDPTDEAADPTSQGEGSGESAGTMEAGSEGGSSSGGESGSGEGPEAGTAEASEASDMVDTSASGSGSETETTTETTTETETETETGMLPVDCTTLDELECPLVDTCASYYGQPFAESIDGMLCLGPAEFLGCLFAEQACLPATGTLCSVMGTFHVDNLCPPPAGFVACQPPIDPPPANCP